MKKLTVFLTLIFSAIIFIISCHKDDMPTSDGGSSSGSSLRTTISGIVLDESNAPLNGAIVSAYGQTTTTNQYGIFVLKNLNVNKDRCVLQFSKAGFFNRAHGFIASANTVNYVRIILISNAATQSFSSSAGGTVSLPDGSSVVFQPNSFVTTSGSAYSGTVNIAFKHLLPDDANFGFMIPGGDLAGKDLNNKDVALYTYGMLGVLLTGSSGETLQLATATTATLTFAVAASQTATAPASIPLWYFDETTSLWKEQGTANKVGNNYVGTVSHFSWWNCDISADSPLIKGKVVDCNGTPVPNIVVTVNGWATTITDQNGEWQGQVPDGMTLTVQVLSSNNNGVVQNSQLVNVPALSSNQTYIVPDLIIACPTRIIGTLKSCSGETTEGMVFITDNAGFNSYRYSNDGSFSLISIPNAQLVLRAETNTNIYQQVVTSLAAPNVLNLGNLLLCDTILTYNNYFTVNGGGLSNQIFNIITTDATANVTNHSLAINIHGSAPVNYIIYYYNIVFNDTIEGTYSWDSGSQGTAQFQIYFNNINADYTLNTLGTSGSSGTVTVTQVDNVGGRVKGFYSGLCGMAINSVWQDSIYVSGHFDVLRTQ